MCGKLTANIILNELKNQIFPVTLRTRYECHISPFMFTILLEVLTTSVRQGREMKQIQTRKYAKVSLFIGYDFLQKRP